MSKSIVIAIAVATAAFGATREAAAWSSAPVSGCATSIAGGAGGDAFITGCTHGSSGGFNLFETTNPAFGWSSLPGQGVQMASDEGGDLWLVNALGNVFVFNTFYGTWSQMPAPGGCATSIAVYTSTNGEGGPGTVYATGCTTESSGGFGIFEASFDYAGNPANPQINGWTELGGQAVEVAVGSSGNVPWIVNKHNQIYQRNGSGWTLEPGCAVAIAGGLGGLPTSIVGCTATGQFGDGLYTWNGSGWTEIAGSSASKVSTDAAGRLWSVNTQGNISLWTNP